MATDLSMTSDLPGASPKAFQQAALFYLLQSATVLTALPTPVLPLTQFLCSFVSLATFFLPLLCKLFFLTKSLCLFYLSLTRTSAAELAKKET